MPVYWWSRNPTIVPYPQIAPRNFPLGLGYTPLFTGGERENRLSNMILSYLFNGFLDRCVSAMFEFSGNEFELGENKIEREREPIIFSYDRGPLNSVIILRKRHNISERYYFGTRKHFEVEDGGREGGRVRLRLRGFW